MKPTRPRADSAYGQEELPILDYMREPDRNFEQGGRSFYFFDFDDNVVHLSSTIVLFHRETNEEKEVSTSDFAAVREHVGKSGVWKDYEVREFGPDNSYRNFREVAKEKLKNGEQPLINDMTAALKDSSRDWRAPAWSFFVHAVTHGRPISVITARGHHPHTIRRAVNLLVQSRDLPQNPNFLSVYPVSNPDTRKDLGDADFTWSIARLKKEAIKRCIKDAFECFGENPYHRFGMSDDDPGNVELIAEAMRELKVLHPKNAFFVFNTHGGQLVREEILLQGTESETLGDQCQIGLFDNDSGDL